MPVIPFPGARASCAFRVHFCVYVWCSCVCVCVAASDANLLFKMDVQAAHAAPELRAVMEATVAENEADFMAPNLKGLPVLARVGGRDPTVHPWEVRGFRPAALRNRLRRLLAETNVLARTPHGLQSSTWRSPLLLVV